MLTLVCPCHFGLESVLKYEAGKIGGENIAAFDGKVVFTGDFATLARANLRLSTAERVLLLVGEFKAVTFEELFQGVKSLPLEDYIGKNDKFPVKGHSLNSTLASVPDCQAIIKKAAVERLKSKYSVSWFEETGALFQIQFGIMNDRVSVYIDTSGAGLHKRGYRKNANLAPIKETLAAGMIDLAHIKADSMFCDPLCGSGTFLIEAAYKAFHIAPGLKRRFTAESWGFIGENIWSEERESARADIKKDALFEAFGFDNDPEAVALTLENCKKAGVGRKITVKQADVSRFSAPDGAITVCNPPYGERMFDIKDAERLYTVMGKTFPANKENPCFIISPHEQFEGFFGKKADKKRKLYNGMMKCQLYMYFK